MNRQPLTSLLALTLLLFSSSLVAAQTASSGPEEAAGREERPGAPKELEKKALDMLDEVIAQAQSLRMAENRVYIHAVAADLLWPHDEKRARGLFKTAMRELIALTNAIDSSDPNYMGLLQAPATLRQEMLPLIAQHDPKLALEFLRATRLPAQGGLYNPRQADQELWLELNVAGQIAAKDPKQALQIAEDSLNKGLSPGLTNLLGQIQDRDAAVELAGKIIDRLHTENLATDQNAANTAVNLLQTLRATNNTPSSVAVDDSVRRELFDMVVTAALSAPNGRAANGDTRQILFNTLQSMMPDVERYEPSQVAALRRQAAAFDRSLDPQTRMWNDYNNLVQNGTVDALLEAAPKAPPEMRDAYYQQAANKALNDGDETRARQIVNDNISDPGQRNQMLANFDQQKIWNATNQGKLDEARQLLSRLPTNEERVGMLIQWATMTNAKGNRKGALQFLDEARGMLGYRAKNFNQLQAQLQLAGAYAPLAPARSFEIIEPGIDQLNELIAAAAVLEGFGQENFKDDELAVRGGTMMSNMVQQYAAALAPLARMDFERTAATADRLQRVEARLMAHLSIVQGILSAQNGARAVSRRSVVSLIALTPGTVMQ